MNYVKFDSSAAPGLSMIIQGCGYKTDWLWIRENKPLTAFTLER